ncbi:MAG TPA: hypothetical protein VGE34_00565 [Candidatus Saccharimonadales bacterium]
MKPRFIIEQKITAMVNKYKILASDEQGNAGQVVALAQQKRLAFKEKVLFYTDESKAALSFTMRAEKVLDIHGKFLVEDANGGYIGGFKKDFGQSLAVSTWHVLDAQDNHLFTVSESNRTVAVLRRYLQFVPLIGDIAELVMVFFRYHFNYVRPGTDQPVAKYEKTTLFRDHYRLSMTDDAYAQVDWRVLVAMSVALDALQGR